jgi:hypothetical protein
MSEARDLNDSASPDPGRSELEELLRSLVPCPLAVDHDVFFFQAGMAAAGQGSNGKRSARVLWPLVAATLLLACGGLSIALARKSAALETALAAAPRETGALASGRESAKQLAIEPNGHGIASTRPSNAVTDAEQDDRLPRADRSEQMFSQEHLPDGQLTAHGWVENPPELREQESESTPVMPKAPARPVEWPIYLELLRTQKG